MKAILEFNLPEEDSEFKYALAGVDAISVIHELDNALRSHIKHYSYPEWDTKTVESIREFLNALTIKLPE